MYTDIYDQPLAVGDRIAVAITVGRSAALEDYYIEKLDPLVPLDPGDPDPKVGVRQSELSKGTPPANCKVHPLPRQQVSTGPGRWQYDLVAWPSKWFKLFVVPANEPNAKGRWLNFVTKVVRAPESAQR